MNVNDLTWGDPFLIDFVSRCVGEMNRVYEEMDKICGSVKLYGEDYVKVDAVDYPTQDIHWYVNTMNGYQDALIKYLMTNVRGNVYCAFMKSLNTMINENITVKVNDDLCLDLSKILDGYCNPVLVNCGIPVSVFGHNDESLGRFNQKGQITLLNIPLDGCHQKENVLYVFERKSGPLIGVGEQYTNGVRIESMCDIKSSLFYTLLPLKRENIAMYLRIINNVFFRPNNGARVRMVKVNDLFGKVF